MSHPSDRISIFSKHQYINLETYRKNGKAVMTPVWFTIDDQRILVVTGNKTGKIKRLKNNPKVRVAPSGIRGQPKGEWHTGNAVLADSAQLERALNLRIKKYGFKARLSRLFSRTKGDLVGIIISLD
jgi:PPOX class probable F420-dependent enzyme